MQQAFLRLDHLLCAVPDIDASFELFHQRLGFPVAWPIGRYWPSGRMCGIALGGANLELIQPDENPPPSAIINSIAFEPTPSAQDKLREAGIPFTVFEKKESDPELLRLRSLPADRGEQLLCTNTIPEPAALEFSFFACDYSAILKPKLDPHAFQIPGDNGLEEVMVGHPEPAALKEQLDRLGRKEGVRITIHKHATREVTALIMKNGPIDLGDIPARFRFIESPR